MSKEKSLHLYNVNFNESEKVISDTSNSLELQKEDVATNSRKCLLGVEHKLTYSKEKEIEKAAISKSKLKKLRKIQRWEETKSMKRFVI